MNQLQFNRVLLHARFELDRFDNSLLQLEAHDYPSEVARQLIEVQRGESEVARAALQTIELDFSDDPAGSAARAQSEYRKLLHRREFLEVLDKACSDEVPWSIVPCVQRMAKSILPGRNVLVTTTPDMNYMIGWSVTDHHQPVTIYLPKLHRANAFLHVLIGHELFHPALKPFLDAERKSATPHLREDCKQLLEKEEGQSDLFSQHRLDNMLNYALIAWEQGITELMCDMGAASIFGPAALWTVSGFAALHNMDVSPTRDSGFYPPWRLRVKVVRDYIHDVDEGDRRIGKIAESLIKVDLHEHSAALLESVAAEEMVCTTSDWSKCMESDHLVAKVYERVVESIPAGQQFVKSVVSQLDDRWTETASGIPSLLKRLALLVPPSEVIRAGDQKSEAAPVSTIVLACWIQRLLEEKNGSLDLRSFQRLSRLMLKAVEDAELKREFSSWGSSS